MRLACVARVGCIAVSSGLALTLVCLRCVLGFLVWVASYWWFAGLVLSGYGLGICLWLGLVWVWLRFVAYCLAVRFEMFVLVWVLLFGFGWVLVVVVGFGFGFVGCLWLLLTLFVSEFTLWRWLGAA